MTASYTIEGPRVTDVDPDVVHDSFCASHLPWDLEFDPRVTPTTSRVDLGAPWVVGCTVGRMHGYRRPAHVRRTPGEYVAVLMVHRGTEVLTQRGEPTRVPAGTAALWDGVRPVECFSAGTLVKDTMFVPRDALAAVVPDLDSALVRTIDDSPTLRLLTSWLDVARQSALDTESALTAGRMAVDLLYSAIARCRGNAADSREVMLLRVKDFLDRNLTDAELTLDTVAQANAISLRYLHLLFEGTGETPRQYLRRRRLERAQQLLHGPDHGLPVAEVAVRAGFDSPSSFSRAFRTAFGMSPRDARRDPAARGVVHAV